VQKRRTLLSNKEGFAEGFSLFSTTQNSEFLNVNHLAETAGISNILPENANLPLKEYVVKSSFNSAQTGTYVNTEMIKYVLSRGCRFIDFEVFSFDDEPYVSFSYDNSFSNIDAKNKIPLADALSIIAVNGFMEPSPNPNDPLFLHLRIRKMSMKLFAKISTAISSILGERLNKCDVTPDTILANLMGKIVLIIDVTTSPDYKTYSICNPVTDKTCNDLTTYVNMESGGDYLRIYKYTELLNISIFPPYIFTDGTTDVNALRIVIPDVGTDITNPNVFDFIVDYGVQFSTYPFFNQDANLFQYEKIFSDNKSAFVPLSIIIPYLNQ
jgi:hypothetical protein